MAGALFWGAGRQRMRAARAAFMVPLLLAAALSPDTTTLPSSVYLVSTGVLPVPYLDAGLRCAGPWRLAGAARRPARKTPAIAWPSSAESADCATNFTAATALGVRSVVLASGRCVVVWPWPATAAQREAGRRWLAGWLRRRGRQLSVMEAAGPFALEAQSARCRPVPAVLGSAPFLLQPAAARSSSPVAGC
jgi:hypothetical protein